MFWPIKQKVYLEISLPFRMCVISWVLPHFIWLLRKVLGNSIQRGMLWFSLFTVLRVGLMSHLCLCYLRKSHKIHRESWPSLNRVAKDRWLDHQQPCTGHTGPYAGGSAHPGISSGSLCPPLVWEMLQKDGSKPRPESTWINHWVWPHFFPTGLSPDGLSFCPCLGISIQHLSSSSHAQWVPCFPQWSHLFNADLQLWGRPTWIPLRLKFFLLITFSYSEVNYCNYLKDSSFSRVMRWPLLSMAKYAF